MFTTPALSRIAKKFSSNIQLQDLIPKLAAKNTRLVIDEMADIIDFPQKSNKPDVSNTKDAKKMLIIYERDIMSIKKYLMKSIGWNQWQRKAIANHTVVDKEYFYYVEGVDVRFWDLTPKNNTDIQTIWNNIGFTSSRKMHIGSLKKCIEESPKWLDFQEIEISAGIEDVLDENIEEKIVEEISEEEPLTEDEEEPLTEDEIEKETEEKAEESTLSRQQISEYFANRNILNEKEAHEHLKETCFYPSCETIEKKRWLCSCCNLAYCYAHSLPEVHMREISQNRESSKRKKYPSEACLNSVLNIIELLAFKKVPQSMNHLYFFVLTRHANTNLDEFLKEIKVHFLVAVLKFHSCIDDIPMGSNMLDHLIKISEIRECFMDGNNDMPLIDLLDEIRNKYIEIRLSSTMTKRRRVVFSSDL